MWLFSDISQRLAHALANLIQDQCIQTAPTSVAQPLKSMFLKQQLQTESAMWAPFLCFDTSIALTTRAQVSLSAQFAPFNVYFISCPLWKLRYLIIPQAQYRFNNATAVFYDPNRTVLNTYRGGTIDWIIRSRTKILPEPRSLPTNYEWSRFDQPWLLRDTWHLLCPVWIRVQTWVGLLHHVIVPFPHPRCI